MALKPCRECGAQVSTAAKACPCCGIDSPGAKVWGERAQAILSLVLFITLVAGVVFAITGAMTDEPSRAIRGDSLRKSAVQTGQEISITLKKGETLGAILRDLGATPEEIRAIAAVLGPRGRDSNLQEGQEIRVLMSPVRGANGEPLLTTHRQQPVRVTLVGETAIEAVVALSDVGTYVALPAVAAASAAPSLSISPTGDARDGSGIRRADGKAIGDTKVCIRNSLRKNLRSGDYDQKQLVYMALLACQDRFIVAMNNIACDRNASGCDHPEVARELLANLANEELRDVLVICSGGRC